MKKKSIFLLGAIVVAGVILVSVLHSLVAGSELVTYIQREDIVQVSVRKTHEDGSGEQDLATLTLSPAEEEQFYACLAESQLKDIKDRPFAFDTTVRYYVSLIDTEGHTAGQLKFYEDEFLIFSYTYGTRPSVHGRYAIRASTLGAFFETVFQ